MTSTLTGTPVVFGIFHVVPIAIPVADTPKAAISRKSKLAWCLFLLRLPVIGIALFRFRASLFRGEKYEISAADERARTGSLRRIVVIVKPAFSRRSRQ